MLQGFLNEWIHFFALLKAGVTDADPILYFVEAILISYGPLNNCRPSNRDIEIGMAERSKVSITIHLTGAGSNLGRPKRIKFPVTNKKLLSPRFDPDSCKAPCKRANESVKSYKKY